jgi:hypothetical protein
MDDRFARRLEEDPGGTGGRSDDETEGEVLVA